MRICALALCLCASGFAQAPATESVVVEQIVAKVNGDIITRTELERSRRELAEALKAQKATPQQIADALKEREKDILRENIDSLLLVQRGKELNIDVDADVRKAIGQIQLEQKIADPEKFAQWVREQTGMSYEDFRNEYKNGMLKQRVVQQEVISKVNLPKSEIEDYYNKNKASFIRKEMILLREIFINTEGKDAAAQAAAEKKAKDLVARARKGERFTDLVRDNSEAVTAKQGGLLDPYVKGDLNPEMEKLVWDKARGYVTDPIKLPNGWEILRVEDHQKEGQAALADVENEIRDRLYGPLVQPKLREFLTELRRNAFLEIRQPYIDTGAAPGKDTSWTDPALMKPETVTKQEVAANVRMKRLLWSIPLPGTKIPTTGTSSSK